MGANNVSARKGRLRKSFLLSRVAVHEFCPPHLRLQHGRGCSEDPLISPHLLIAYVYTVQTKAAS